MTNKLEILTPDNTYHIYNRANGSEKMFLEEENYHYFLKKYAEYIQPIAETFCYCLMPNHFHFLIRIKSTSDLESFFNDKLALKAKDPKDFALQALRGFEIETARKPKDPKGFENPLQSLRGFETLEGIAKESALNKLIAQRFSHFFNSYAQAFNKQQQRKGSLFMHPFKRKLITDEQYLRNLVHYIHFNPVEAGLANKPHNWEHSSYNRLILNDTAILNNEIIEWFDDKENFMHFHQYNRNMMGVFTDE